MRKKSNYEMMESESNDLNRKDEKNRYGKIALCVARAN